MALQPPRVGNPLAQRAIDFLARRFPLTAEDIATGAVGSAELADGGVGVAELATAAKQLFPQLSTPATKIENSGAASVSTSGSVSGTQSVTHDLGTTPDAVQATSSDSLFCASVTAKTSTTFTITVRHINASSTTTTMDVYWRAIG